MPQSLELTPRVVHEVAALVRNGLPIRTAARALEIPPSNLDRWLTNGYRRGDRPSCAMYREFVSAIHDAQRERELEVEALVADARRRLDAPSVRIIATRQPPPVRADAASV